MSNADELLKYKELLDSNIITPEEFEKKKKELLYGETIIENKVEEKVQINVNVDTPIREQTKNNMSKKSWIVTLLLCLFFGMLGIHRFYVGKIGTGILQLITVGGFGIWWLIDVIIVLIGQFKDIDGYVIKPKERSNVNINKSEQSRKLSIFTIMCIFIIIVFCIGSGMNVPTTNNYYEAPIVLDVNKFYKENKTDTVTEEELIQIMGEPTKKDTWNYKIINKSYKITTLLYPESKEFHFYKGKLSWITITEEYKHYSNEYTLAMFNLAKNENTIEVQNNNISFRYRNCGVYDFWVTKDVLFGDGDKVNWIKIKLVESEF